MVASLLHIHSRVLGLVHVGVRHLISCFDGATISPAEFTPTSWSASPRTPVPTAPHAGAGWQVPRRSALRSAGGSSRPCGSPDGPRSIPKLTSRRSACEARQDPSGEFFYSRPALA